MDLAATFLYLIVLPACIWDWLPFEGRWLEGGYRGNEALDTTALEESNCGRSKAVSFYWYDFRISSRLHNSHESCHACRQRGFEHKIVDESQSYDPKKRSNTLLSVFHRCTAWQMFLIWFFLAQGWKNWKHQQLWIRTILPACHSKVLIPSVFRINIKHMVVSRAHVFSKDTPKYFVPN